MIPYSAGVTLREELMAEIDRIARITNPEEQARAVAQLLRDLQVTRTEAVRIRAEVVRQLRANRSHAEIADLLGLKKGTAQLIAEGRQTGRRRNPSPDRGIPPPE